jgi:hypothetical protein
VLPSIEQRMDQYDKWVGVWLVDSFVSQKIYLAIFTLFFSGFVCAYGKRNKKVYATHFDKKYRNMLYLQIFFLQRA